LKFTYATVSTLDTPISTSVKFTLSLYNQRIALHICLHMDNTIMHCIVQKLVNVAL